MKQHQDKKRDQRGRVVIFKKTKRANAQDKCQGPPVYDQVET